MKIPCDNCGQSFMKRGLAAHIRYCNSADRWSWFEIVIEVTNPYNWLRVAFFVFVGCMFLQVVKENMQVSWKFCLQFLLE